MFLHLHLPPVWVPRGLGGWSQEPKLNINSIIIMCWPLSLVPPHECFFKVVPAFFVFRQICPIVWGCVVFAYVSFDVVNPSCLWSSLSSFCVMLDIGGRIPRCSCDCPFVTRIAGHM